MSKRAERRHHYQRLKAKRVRDGYWGLGFFKEAADNLVGIAINTPHPCSNCCCGNPRKHFHDRTIQELKSEIDFDEQVDEYYEWYYEYHDMCHPRKWVA